MRLPLSLAKAEPKAIPVPSKWAYANCKSHVKGNTQALIEELRPLVDKESDGSPGAIGVESAQALVEASTLRGTHHRLPTRARQ